MYSISEFANLVNVSSKTLRLWDKSGKLVPIKLESGHRRYTEEHLAKIKGIRQAEKINVIYCRESTNQQKESLHLQEEKCKQFCISLGLKIDKVLIDTGSGMNYKRKGFIELLELLTTNKVDNLVIYYKDRLVRFGFEMFSALAKIHEFKILVIDDSETKKSKEKEFADDLISIIHYFSMKLYGSRSYKKKIKPVEDCINKIKEEIEQE